MITPFRCNTHLPFCCFVFRVSPGMNLLPQLLQELECCFLAFSSREHCSAGSNNLGMRRGRDDLKFQRWRGDMGNKTSKCQRRSVVGYFFCE